MSRSNIKLEVSFKPNFVRRFARLEPALQDEVFEAIEALKNRRYHERLKVHKLEGRLKDCYSCSVNYQYRLVFIFQRATEITLLDMGDHDVYK